MLDHNVERRMGVMWTFDVRVYPEVGWTINVAKGYQENPNKNSLWRGQWCGCGMM